MKKVFLVALSAVVVISIITLWSSAHYILRADKGFIVIDKRFMTFTDTFADIRTWSSKDFDLHPEIKEAMVSQGYCDILIELKIREIKADLMEMGEKIYTKAEEGADAVQRKVDEWLKSSKSECQEPNISEPNSK